MGKLLLDFVYMWKDCINGYFNSLIKSIEARMTLVEYNLSYRELDNPLELQKSKEVIEAERILSKKEECKKIEKDRRNLARKLEKTAW